jgi:hypothetical protein
MTSAKIAVSRYLHNYSLTLQRPNGYWQLIVWRHWQKPELRFWPFYRT